MTRNLCLLAAVMLPQAALAGSTSTLLADWPRVTSAIGKDAALEARAAKIVASMNLRQKVGQITQAEIQSITPDEVRQYYVGSVLNGGGSWPGKNKHATPADWVALADQFYDASMSTDMPIKVPVIWGIDAIHGNSGVYGATLFPHNIGLGAAHNEKLVGQIGASVGKAVRATGINWVFAPTLAVVQDDRWGRTYESFSEDGLLVKAYARAYVEGLQGRLNQEGNVIATAKHFLGDGGTDQGKDQGETQASLVEMINIHGQGYYGALAAGVQTVMASFSGWNDTAAGINHGKMHGNKALLTDVLKTKMGFDGFIVSDWNGHGQVPGCTNDSCAAAINAGIDMIMVPQDWKAFIANTIKQVESGQIPMSRIDDAVVRIVRVKLRAGMFDRKPSQNAYAGKAEAMQARALARQAVRESLVLLKNNGALLPLAGGKKILVVGKSADNLPNQTGGWTLTWQGTENKNSDFPNGDTILSGIVEAAGKDNVTYSVAAEGVDVAQFDAVIAVIGETPYAEFVGDIGPSGTLRHSGRYPEDLSVLQAVAGKGKPVVTVLVAGRPLYTNDLMNLSDSFVAAWLPGSEGKGVADVLFRKADGKINHPFTGTLSFSWPKSACQARLNIGDKDYDPLFAPGYGLKSGERSSIGQLEDAKAAGSCGATNTYPVFTFENRAAWPLYVVSGAEQIALGNDPNKVFDLPAVKAETAQVSRQHDAKKISWNGAARFEARGTSAVLPSHVVADGALQFDVSVMVWPQGSVTVEIGCSTGCAAKVDVTEVLRRMVGAGKQTIKIPLSCFTARGADLTRMDRPFSIATDKPFVAAFADIQFVGGTAKDKDVLDCAGVK